MAEPRRALVDNAGSEKQVRAAQKIARRRRAQEVRDIQALLQMPEGRRVLWRILEKCGTFRSVWHPSSLISYNSGQQDLGHWLLNEVIEVQPAAYVQMLTEDRDVIQQEKAEVETATTTGQETSDD